MMNRLFRSRSHRLLIGIVLILVLGLIAAPIRAADTRGGEQVVIDRNEVIGDDLYLAANTVTINGTVKGDVVAMASQITINGTSRAICWLLVRAYCSTAGSAMICVLLARRLCSAPAPRWAATSRSVL